MYNLPPNHILFIRKGVLSLARNRYFLHSNWVVKSKAVSFAGHVKYLEKKADKVNIDLEVTNKTKENNWQKVFKVNKDSFNVQKFPMQSQVNSYTDGSKNEDHVGRNFGYIEGIRKSGQTQ